VLVTPTPDTGSVLAIVLTYNAPASLLDCLGALKAQTRRPDAVLVIDNASAVPAADAVESAELPASWVTVLRQRINTGPAGGHAAGLREFIRAGQDAAWVMDDDCIPEPDCLERLLEKGLRKPEFQPFFVFPNWVQPDGTVSYYPAWCGFLIAREIVEKVGLPMEELFWWVEDTEYLMWRIPRAGHPRTHAKAATVHHTQVRSSFGNPSWKYYYETRNMIFYHLYVMRNPRELPRKLGLLLARLVVRERRQRPARLIMMARGLVDGVLRRLGKRVQVDSS